MRLRETQHEFARALVSGDAEAIADEIIGGAFSPAERLAIYRNTFIASLTNALALSYPAVKRLVGDDFFAAAAGMFIESDLPVSAYLNIYGAGFADFLKTFPPAASLPYLADVARLEWAVNGALHAADAKSLDRGALAGIAPEHLILIPHPSLTLLRVEHPARAIWQAVLAEDDAALGALDLNAGNEWLLVAREDAGVIVHVLDEADARFAGALLAGKNFATACAAVSFERASHLFAQHLALGHFTGFHDSSV